VVTSASTISESANSEARRLFNQRDPHAQCREHAGVLDAITPPPTTISVLGISGIFRIWSLLIMFRLLKGTNGDSAGLVPVAMTTFAVHSRLILGTHHMNVRRIGKAGQPGKDFDSIARELSANDVDFRFDDVLRAEGKIGHADLIFHTVVYAVNVL